jgi:16S rRNA (adenine(1408)-N(1))-methyltransferase
MRNVNGKKTRQLDAAEVAVWAETYPNITIDLGTGDGRFVRQFAERYPERGAIALDLCETNLRPASRNAPGNALFVVADALALPGELDGLARRVTVNFPWGSLLRALVQGDQELLAGLAAIASGHTTLEMVLNAGALAEVGWPLEPGAERIAAALRQIGAAVGEPRLVGPAELCGYPTTWAKRLAFGRDPRAIRIEASLVSRDDDRSTVAAEQVTISRITPRAAALVATQVCRNRVTIACSASSSATRCHGSPPRIPAAASPIVPRA